MSSQYEYSLEIIAQIQVILKMKEPEHLASRQQKKNLKLVDHFMNQSSRNRDIINP
jgi:hypothetical protein